MTAIKNWLTCLMLVAVATFFFTLSYEVIHVSKHTANALMAITDTSDHLNKTISSVNTTVTNVNAVVLSTNNIILGLDKPHGTISDLNADLGAVRLAVDNVNQVALKERFFLDKTQPEEVAKLNAVADTANETIRQVQPVLTSASDELQALKLATISLNSLVSDEQLTQTIANVNSTTKHLDATAADVQSEVHSLTHPTWAHKIFSWSLDVAHAFNPL